MKDWADIFDDLTPTDEKLATGNPMANESQRYKRKEQIAEGGMKRIYRVHDERAGRDCAMAVLKNTDQESEVFLREARLCAFLQHPNIMPVYDIDQEADGQPYFIMKLLEGESLGSKLRTSKPKNLLEERDHLLQIFLRICEAVAYAHSRGVVHLDLKPDNIQLGPFGETLLCDWGLAHLIGAGADEQESLLDDDFFAAVEERHYTLYGQVKGTPGYMSPEQARAQGSRKNRSCDIFSLGAVLYTILCGKAPIIGKTAEEIVEKTRIASIDEAFFRRDEFAIPAGLEAVCFKALSLEAEDRYLTVEELISDVEKVLRGFAPLAEEASTLRQLKLFYQRNQWLCLLTLLFFMTFSVVASVFTISLSHSEMRARRALEERRKIGQAAAKEYFAKAEYALTKQDQSKLIELIEMTLRSDPEHKKAWLFRGWLSFIKHSFKEAKLAFEKSGGKDSEFMIELCDIMQVRSKEDLAPLEIYDELKSQKMKWWHRIYIKERFESEVNYGNKMPYLRELILQMSSHKKRLKKNFQMKYSEKNGYRKIDLSNNPKMKGAWYLRLLELDEIDMSNTGLQKPSFLNGVRLQKVDISHTPVADLSYLNDVKVRSLDISHTQVKWLQALWQFELEELDIRSTRVKNLSPLLSMESLKRVYLDRDKYNKSILEKLSLKMEILP